MPPATTSTSRHEFSHLITHPSQQPLPASAVLIAATIEAFQKSFHFGVAQAMDFSQAPTRQSEVWMNASQDAHLLFAVFSQSLHSRIACLSLHFRNSIAAFSRLAHLDLLPSPCHTATPSCHFRAPRAHGTSTRHSRKSGCHSSTNQVAWIIHWTGPLWEGFSSNNSHQTAAEPARAAPR